VKIFTLIVLLLMTSCAARHESPQVQATNPYQVRAEGLARSGVDALGREQWERAQMLFEKSLQAATLADNQRLMSLAWYNLGRARAAGGDINQARQAFIQAIRQADEAQDAVSRQRAGLALALLDGPASPAGNEPASIDLLRVPDAFPVDVHLAAARLAYLKHQPELARHAYGRVLEKAGQDRSGLTYAARAHLGLTQLVREQAAKDGAGDDAAWKHLNQALDLLRRSGEPRLMLKALYLAAEMEANPVRRQQWLQRAKAVQQALQKTHKE
jgi:tetratricopeptide (TPR) repeat protein